MVSLAQRPGRGSQTFPDCRRDNTCTHPQRERTDDRQRELTHQTGTQDGGSLDLPRTAPAGRQQRTVAAMDEVAERITQALGVGQGGGDDDEDINMPLKATKPGGAPSRRPEPGPSAGTAVTVCLVTFALLFGAFVSFTATVSTAQLAWDAHGYASGKVAANEMQQQADWSKSLQARGQALTEAQGEIAQLKRELRQAQLARAVAPPARSQRAGGARRSDRRHPVGWRDHWGHEDYATEVQRKERQEEKHIKSKLAKEDRDTDKVEEAGLDKAHIKELNRQKAAISRQDNMARKLGKQDYNRREKEVDSLIPDDANCPGPACLTNVGPKSGGPRAIKMLHKHAPWQRHYPDEMDNVMKSTPWVKVSGVSDFQRQKQEAAAMVPVGGRARGRSSAGRARVTASSGRRMLR